MRYAILAYIQSIASILMMNAVSAQTDLPGKGEMKVGYQMSYANDLCGDPIIGSAWRKAYRIYARECQFPISIFKEFSDIDVSIEEVLATRRMNKPFPAGNQTVFGYSCDYIRSPQWVPEVKRGLRAFMAGTVSASTALGLNCDGSHVK